MLIITVARARGTALVFMLMALIAALALAVVFLSRIGRDDSKPGATAPQEAVTPVTDNPLLDDPTTGAQPSATITPAPQMAPPPPPPIATPDTRDLPPEG